MRARSGWHVSIAKSGKRESSASKDDGRSHVLGYAGLVPWWRQAKHEGNVIQRRRPSRGYIRRGRRRHLRLRRQLSRGHHPLRSRERRLCEVDRPTWLGRRASASAKVLRKRGLRLDGDGSGALDAGEACRSPGPVRRVSSQRRVTFCFPSSESASSQRVGRCPG